MAPRLRPAEEVAVPVPLGPLPVFTHLEKAPLAPLPPLADAKAVQGVFKTEVLD